MNNSNNNSSINPKKMAIINEFKKMAKNQSQENMLPLVLALTKKANSMGVNFTKDEMMIIINSMRPNMSQQESSNIDMILNMMK